MAGSWADHTISWPPLGSDGRTGNRSPWPCGSRKRERWPSLAAVRVPRGGGAMYRERAREPARVRGAEASGGDLERDGAGDRPRADPGLAWARAKGEAPGVGRTWCLGKAAPKAWRMSSKFLPLVNLAGCFVPFLLSQELNPYATASPSCPYSPFLCTIIYTY